MCDFATYMHHLCCASMGKVFSNLCVYVMKRLLHCFIRVPVEPDELDTNVEKVFLSETMRSIEICCISC